MSVMMIGTKRITSFEELEKITIQDLAKAGQASYRSLGRVEMSFTYTPWFFWTIESDAPHGYVEEEMTSSDVLDLLWLYQKYYGLE
jgi:hypothetical protein